MKKINLVFAVLLIFMTAISCNPTAKEAKDYSDKVLEQTQLITDKIADLTQAYDTYNGELIDEAFDKSSKQITETINTLNEMSGLNGDKSLLESALKLAKNAKSVLEKEHSELVRLSKIPENEYTDAHVTTWDANMNAAKSKLAGYQNEFKKALQNFENKYQKSAK